MGPRAKSKTKALSVVVPQNREQAAKMLADYGKALRDLQDIENAMNGDLATIKQQGLAKAEPVSARADAMFKGLQAYCEANRADLTDNNKTKTADLGTGKVSWRHNPAEVSLRGKVEDIITRIRNAGAEFQIFLRQVTAIDKVAMLRNPNLAEKIEGVKIASAGEMFAIEPFGSEELPEGVS